jgi:hypothetical protein
LFKCCLEPEPNLIEGGNEIRFSKKEKVDPILWSIGTTVHIAMNVFFQRLGLENGFLCCGTVKWGIPVSDCWRKGPRPISGPCLFCIKEANALIHLAGYTTMPEVQIALVAALFLS